LRLFHERETLLSWSLSNTLSEAQITAILDGKQVIAAAPPSRPQVKRLLKVMQTEMTREALQSALDLQDRKSFRERYLKPALEDGLIEMTIPGKPNSRLQKYRLTDKGRRRLQQRAE
jgi:hypothetical protein